MDLRVIDAGDRALALRDDDTLRWLASHETLASLYIGAALMSRTGPREQAAETLRHVIALAPPPLQAKAFISLGSCALAHDEIDRAEAYYRQAARLATDPLGALQCARVNAVLLSAKGQHRAALDTLNRAVPLRRSIRPGHPVLLDFYNSIAVELCALGHASEALPVISHVTSAPVPRIRLEWLETAQEIAAQVPCRPFVAVGALPVEAAPLAKDIEREPGRLIAFPERRTESESQRSGRNQFKATEVASNTQDPIVIDTIINLENSIPSGRLLANRASKERDEVFVQSVLGYWDRYENARLRKHTRRQKGK